jgi:3-dehydroquinate dehydratase-2
MPRILVINGPNLNMLGIREVGIYGSKSLDDISRELAETAAQAAAELEFFQSNHEGEIIDEIQRAHHRVDFIIINPGALTHYSISLYDALKSVNIPFIEVHLSNIYAREEFRRHSLLSPIAAGVIMGLGAEGYNLALQSALKLLRKG